MVAFLPPVTLVTGLLFYFGWARTYAQARALGADASVFGYSTQDYLLRSVDSLYFPIAVLTVTALAALLAHQWVRGRLAAVGPGWPDRRLARAGEAIAVAGAAIMLFGAAYAAGLLGRGRGVDLLGPLTLGAGILMLAYGGWLRARARGSTSPGAFGQAPPSSWSAPVAAGLLVLMVALSLFWTVGNYATWRGQDLASLIATTYRSRPSVVVYSSDSLGLEGVSTTRLDDGEDVRYTWRYSGMRLLDRVGQTYFLMPEDWSADPRLILLSEQEGTRFELVRPR